MLQQRFRFGDFTVDTACGSLVRGSAPIALRPKAYALLEYLVRNAGRLVGKDELLGAVWGSVVVTDDSLTRCVSDVRAALGNGSQHIVKTVSRRGYLFAAPVVVLDAATAIEPAARLVPPVPPSMPAAAPEVSRRHRHAGAAALFVALLGMIALGVEWQQRREPAAPLSVVVLPFAALATNGAPSAPASALTADLTSALARLHRVRVVAAGGSPAGDAEKADVRSIGADLDVRYVVVGSTQPSGNQLRVNVRLLDARTATTLWTDQFDVDAGDPLRAQDDIVLRLASALDVELVQAHIARIAAVEPARLDADDLAMRCVGASRVGGGESGAPSYAFCEQALEKDPRNVRALARLGLYFADRVSRGQSLEPGADLDRAAALAARALDADPGYAGGHCAQAMVLEGRHRVRDAIAAAERCLALNPGNAGAVWLLAIEHFFLADPERTLAYADRGLRLAPNDPRLSGFLLFKGWACLQLGNDGEALGWLRQAHAVAPNSPNIALALTVAQVRDGRLAEARTTMNRYLALPRTRIRTVSQWDHRPDANARFAVFAEQVNAALLSAGMPP